ncbi:hypothetical protein GCM10010350_46590 [Streptomyces galilaeus]|nr:hypothetical protein GCM10010350_46590 [Streptomyces galilaeus]
MARRSVTREVVVAEGVVAEVAPEEVALGEVMRETLGPEKGVDRAAERFLRWRHTLKGGDPVDV